MARPKKFKKHVLLQNLSIYYKWKKIRKHYESNKPKIIVPTWNDEFELLGGFYYVSYIQDYIEYNIRKHDKLTTIPPIHIYIKKINSGLVLKVKDRYKLELKTPETMKLFGGTKK